MTPIRLAFPTDEHYPFQDENARSVALKVVSDFDPHVLISGSDGLDFYAISNFDKNPDRTLGIQGEIDRWRTGQREWKSAAPNARPFFLRGNHEDRLRRWLWRHPELYDLEALKLPQLLGLDDLGVIWEHEKGEGANWELSIYGLVVKHGKLIRNYSAGSAKAEVERERFARSTLTAHTHRGGSYYATTRDGVVQGHECFCLCSLNPEYVRRPDWQQGIVLAEVGPDFLNVEPVLIQAVNGKKTARWRGKEYS